MNGRAAVPALYDCTIRHVRVAPLRNDFRYGSYLWLVDLDRLPCPPWPLRPLARIRPGDHAGDSRRTLRENLDRFLADHELTAERILMLTNARVLGFVFNPLTVYWCYDGSGRLVCTVAEVHNTYGGRHRYLLLPGTRKTPKEFYVSPFHPVDGYYRMILPPPTEQLTLTITLHRDGNPPFVASVRGRHVPGTAFGLIRMAVKHPIAPLIVSVRIRRQGVALYLRGLEVARRRGGMR